MGKRDGLDQETKKNNLKPNGFHFLLSGKRSSMPRPNSFLCPVKRDAQSFNIPRPNGFMFPQALGKRASGELYGLRLQRLAVHFPRISSSRLFIKILNTFTMIGR